MSSFSVVPVIIFVLCILVYLLLREDPTSDLEMALQEAREQRDEARDLARKAGKQLGDAQDLILELMQDSEALQEYLEKHFEIIEGQPPGYVAQQLLESFRIQLQVDPLDLREELYLPDVDH